MSLTERQKQYIWLAGSYPDRILEQGRGIRGRRLAYALNLPDKIVVFGYGNPMIWLVNRGLFRKLQARNCYTLTDQGETVFQKLVLSQAGLRLNAGIRETQAVDPRSPDLQ